MSVDGADEPGWDGGANSAVVAAVGCRLKLCGPGRGCVEWPPGPKSQSSTGV